MCSNKRRLKLKSNGSATLSFLQRVNMPSQFEETAASIRDIIMGNSLGAEALRSWRLGVGEIDFCFFRAQGGRDRQIGRHFLVEATPSWVELASHSSSWWFNSTTRPKEAN